MSTPSKRRRTSPTTYVATDQENQENQNADEPNPSTPKRASYLSPTKASLARSNPRVLRQVTQAKQTRESEPNRRQSLRDVVLGPKDNSTHVSRSIDEEPVLVNPTPDPLVDSIANAFRDIPSGAGPEPGLGLTSSHKSPPRSISNQSTLAALNFLVAPVASSSIVPRLVQSTNTNDDANYSRRSTSTDLPPTPVQLGKDTNPNRPKGLASSSPGGSGRRRVRTRNGNVTSSPLKPRDAPPVPTESEKEEEAGNPEIASGIEDDLEDNDEHDVEVGVPEYMVDHFDDPVIQEKERQFRQLREQLKSLQQECEKIEAFSDSISKTNTEGINQSEIDTGLEYLLDHLSPPPAPRLPPPEEHDLFKKNPTAYLTLFTPAKLQMSYQTWSKKIKGIQKFVYQTTFAPLEPWPPSVLNITFETTIELDHNRIEEIKLMDNSVQSHIPNPLQYWIDQRLNDPLLKHDLATITAGIGKYFEEDIKRARIMKHLVENLGMSQPPATNFQLDEPTLSRHDRISLLPYLNISSQTFTATATATTAQSSSEEPHHSMTTADRGTAAATKQLMLIYDINLNWIGQPSTHVEICTSSPGFSLDAIRHARDLFRGTAQVDGVVKALEVTWDVLGMHRDGDLSDQSVGVPGKGGKRRKTRRMTEFH